ncbi:MAG: class I SAM-dependent methyltransferase [Candidatus Zixiibacteriota bacterium]
MTTPSAYSLPHIYEIAFDWRDVPGECDFLIKEAERHLGHTVKSAMELACGPAFHVREMARRGIVSHGMDLAPEMVGYANQQLRDQNLAGQVFLGDMRNFAAPQTYDVVYILLVSFAHLLSNQDILDNLTCAANMLNPGGIYIISTAHPRDFYGDKPVSDNVETSWTSEREGVSVTTDWGGTSQQYDPLTEIDEVTISYTVTENGKTERHDCPEKLRRLSFQTLTALLRLNGRFAIANLLGDFDSAIPLTSAEESARMIVVARKLD